MFAFLALATSCCHGDEIASAEQDDLSRRYNETAHELLRSSLSSSTWSALRKIQTLLVLGYIEPNACLLTEQLKRAFDTLDRDSLKKMKRNNVQHTAAEITLMESHIRTVWSANAVCCKLSLERKMRQVLSFEQLCSLPLPCSDSSYLWGRPVETDRLEIKWNCWTASREEVGFGDSKESGIEKPCRVHREESSYGAYYVVLAALQKALCLMQPTNPRYACANRAHQSL